MSVLATTDPEGLNSHFRDKKCTQKANIIAIYNLPPPPPPNSNFWGGDIFSLYFEYFPLENTLKSHIKSYISPYFAYFHWKKRWKAILRANLWVFHRQFLSSQAFIISGTYVKHWRAYIWRTIHYLHIFFFYISDYTIFKNPKTQKYTRLTVNYLRKSY